MRTVKHPPMVRLTAQQASELRNVTSIICAAKRKVECLTDQIAQGEARKSYLVCDLAQLETQLDVMAASVESTVRRWQETQT